MTRRALAVAAVGAVAVAGAVPALAVLGSVPVAGSLPTPWSGEVVAAPAPSLPDDPRAERALQRAVHAARFTSYRGVAAVQEWGAEGGVGRVVDVVRIAGSGTRVRVRGTMEDPTFSPDQGAPTAAPGDSGRVLGLLARNFAVTLAGTDRVAGRSAEVVEARRAGGTVAARVWLDRRTGLVLRREVYDGAGRTVQSAGFLRLRVGGGRDGDPIAGDLAGGAAEAAFDGSPPQAWTASVPPAEAGALRAHGWACPSVLPDGLTMVDLRRGEVDGAQVLQMVYSDGLTTLSLFEQRGRLDADRLQGFRAADVAGVQAWTRPGAPTQVVWQSGDSVMTLVADAPSDLAASVVAALSGPGAAPDGLVDRVGRGLARLADAMTPWS